MKQRNSHGFTSNSNQTSLNLNQSDTLICYYINIFCLTCVKLTTGLEISKVQLAMTFLSLQLRSTKAIGCLYLGGKVCVTGCHMTSHNQSLSQAEKRDPGNEVELFSVILETTILSNTIMLLPARHLVSELDSTAEMFAACLVQFRQVLRWPIIFELSGNVVQQRHEEKCCIPIRPV